MKAIDRIYQYLEYKAFKVSDFEKKNSISNGYLSKMRQRSASIGEDILNQILENFPDISPEWLLTGIGDMLKSYKSPQPVDTVAENTGIEYYRSSSVNIPVIDISAAAGLVGHINSGSIDVIDYISIPARLTHRGSQYYTIRARGESMSPTIYDSSFVIVRELDRSEWSDMADEHVFVVVSGESAYLKRVKNRLNKGFIVCMSDNTDKYSYPNFNLQAEEITAIFYAEFLISAKMPNINETYYSRVKLVEDRLDNLEQLLKKIQ